MTSTTTTNTSSSSAGYTLQRTPPPTSSSSGGGSVISSSNLDYYYQDDDGMMMAAEVPTVLLLGGWTPGPIPYLRSRLQQQQQQQQQQYSDQSNNDVSSRVIMMEGGGGRRGINVNIVEPYLLMPPWRGFWCWDLHFILMLGVVACLLAGLWHVLFVFPATTSPPPDDDHDHQFSSKHKQHKRKQHVLYVILLLSILGYWIRLMVAVVARSAQQDGIQKCWKEMKNRNVVLCVGFSWGAGVLSELLTRDFTTDTQKKRGGLEDSYPDFLLLAPVSAAASMAAMRPDAATRLHCNLLEQQQQSDSDCCCCCRVHVIHASDDPIFCPYPERWEQVTGISNTTLIDNHTFSKRSSRQMIGDIMMAMLSAKTHGNNP